MLAANGAVGEENRVLVRLQAQNDKMVLQTDGKHNDGTLAAVWWNSLDLAMPHHVVDVEWWAEDQVDAEGGTLLVTINGLPRGMAVDIDNPGQRIEDVQFGAKGIDLGAVGTFFLDDFLSFTVPP